MSMGIDRTSTVDSASVLLTASSDTYVPNTTGWNVGDSEYFGYDIIMEEATGNTPGVTVSLDVSIDGTNWLTYSQSVFYPIDGAASGTLTIADENHDMGSIKPMPCKYIRFKCTEGNGDDDVTATIQLYRS